MKILLHFTILISALALTQVACCSSSSQVRAEMAMTPGMVIELSAPGRAITISAREGLERSYQTALHKNSVHLQARTERWFGSLGAYYGGFYAPSALTEILFPKLSGPHRCFQEGQLNFSSTKMALSWLAKRPGFERRFYRNDGLSVWYFDNRNCMFASVFQIYIRGRKPTRLPDAQDDIIHVRGIQTNDPVALAPMDEAEPNMVPISGMHEQPAL